LDSLTLVLEENLTVFFPRITLSWAITRKNREIEIRAGVEVRNKKHVFGRVKKCWELMFCLLACGFRRKMEKVRQMAPLQSAVQVILILNPRSFIPWLFRDLLRLFIIQIIIFLACLLTRLRS